MTCVWNLADSMHAPLGNVTVNNTQLPQVPHICVSESVSIGPDNGLWPGPLGINFSEVLITINIFSSSKMHLKTSSAKWWQFCPGGDELKYDYQTHRPQLQLGILLWNRSQWNSIRPHECFTNISIVYRKTAVTLLLTHNNYYSLMLSHRLNLQGDGSVSIRYPGSIIAVPAEFLLLTLRSGHGCAITSMTLYGM